MLTKKAQRKLLYAAERIFKAKSLIAWESFKEIPATQLFSRELRLKDHRSVFLSDSGYKHFSTVVEIVDQADLFDGAAQFSDIWTAWGKAVEHWFSEGLTPQSADEVVDVITDRVSREIDDYTYVVPIFGIELAGVDSFPLGKMAVLKMSPEVLDSAGVKHNREDVGRVLESSKHYLWLKGTARGTPRVAQRRFTERAVLTTGMLAITAASHYEGGATGFRIGVAITAEEALGRANWFSWGENGRSLTTHFQYARGQPLPVNTALECNSNYVRMVLHAFQILQAKERTQLEEAITKAVYWYSDAHRDPLPVMKLVKYWSCVEAFFTLAEDERVTHAVSSGLATILVFGGFGFVPPSEYRSLKSHIAKIYKLRCQALHRGVYGQIPERELGLFSQWIAWMIVSMVGLVTQGYTTLHQVKEQTDRLDRVASETQAPA